MRSSDMIVPPANPPLTGRTDPDEGPLALRVHQLVKPFSGDNVELSRVLIGFRSDEGVRRNQGRLGARDGPIAIRRSIANLGVDSVRVVYDAGDIVCEDERLEEAQRSLGDVIADITSRGHRAVVVGGGHEVAFGTFLGVTQSLARMKIPKRRKIAVVNIDAHFDIRGGARSTSGTPFAQILDFADVLGLNVSYFVIGISKVSNTLALFERARLYKVCYLLDSEVQSVPKSFLDEIVENFDYIYLSVDFDSLPGYLMPAVSAPASLGVPLGVVEETLATLIDCGKVLAIDFAEFSPCYDIGMVGERAAARLVFAALFG